jgi:hypothetical protein
MLHASIAIVTERAAVQPNAADKGLPTKSMHASALKTSKSKSEKHSLSIDSYTTQCTINNHNQILATENFTN